MSQAAIFWEPKKEKVSYSVWRTSPNPPVLNTGVGGPPHGRPRPRLALNYSASAGHLMLAEPGAAWPCGPSKGSAAVTHAFHQPPRFQPPSAPPSGCSVAPFTSLGWVLRALQLASPTAWDFQHLVLGFPFTHLDPLLQMFRSHPSSSTIYFSVFLRIYTFILIFVGFFETAEINVHSISYVYVEAHNDT